jgi:Tol biopolymer transport system component
MPDLDAHFRSLSQVDTPNLWRDIEERIPRRSPEPRRDRHGSRVAAAVVALVLAAVSFGLIVRAFRAHDAPPQPAGTAPVGRLAYVVKADGESWIWVANADGTDAHRFVQGSAPRWSPDGTELAFTSGPEQQIRILRRDGSGRQNVLEVSRREIGFLGTLTWSPDGTKIAFASETGIYVVNTDGSGLHKVTQYRGDHACYDLEPSWSPDGSTIMFAVTCEGGSEGIWSVRVDGSEESVLLSGDYGSDDYRSPVWSPDGTQIAIVHVRWEGKNASFGGAGIEVMNADGTDARPVIGDVAFDQAISWSPDGRQLAFERYDYEGTSGSSIVVANPDGTDATSVISEAELCCPTWEPGTQATATPNEGTSETPSESPRSAQESVYLPIFFMGTDRWHTQDGGPVKEGDGAAAWASTIPFDPADLADNAPAIPPETIAQLPDDGIIVTALVVPWAHDPAKGPYPPDALRPYDLSTVTPRGPEAEEPAGNYSVLEIPDRYVLVRVYVGSSSPSEALVQRAQAELDTLEIPPVCPVPARGGYGASLSPSSSAPGDTVTVEGPMPFRHEDGSYDTSGETKMVAWWNASPNDWEHLSPIATVAPSPVGTGPVLRLGEGGTGACSFAIQFNVPDVPPGAYPVVVLQEGSRSWTIEESLVFHVS